MPGLDDRVLALELRAVRAVALLEPAGRPVDADPAGTAPCGSTRLPDDVPQPGALLDRDVQLPAEVADVGDARREDAQRPDLDRPAGGEREALVGDVVTGDAREDVARARPPEPERAPRGRQVGELGGAVGREDGREPLAIGHPVRAARDDPELLVAEPHDREVGLEAAAGREPGRVHDPADGDVDLPLGHDLEGVERSRPGDVEDRECGEVEDAQPARASRGAPR